MENKYHLDRYLPAEWMTSSFQKMEEGYLHGKAIVTNTGVFIYYDEQGNEVRELRPPEEVFDSASVASLKLKPVTNNHPLEMVTVENIKKYQVGHLGENPSSGITTDTMTDGYHVAMDMILTDPEAIQDVKNGKRSLSCGYTCDLEEADPGAVWCGQPYDFIQRNIRYNHVAIVDKGRAGDAAQIRLDSGSKELLIKNYNKEDTMPDLKKISLDGVEYEAEAKVIEALNSTKRERDANAEKFDAVSKDISKLEGERDNLKDQVDALTVDNEKLKAEKMDSTKVDEMVKERMRVFSIAEKMDVEVKDEMENIDVMKLVITSKFPKANLDGKDEVYIQARFDGIVEAMEEDGDAENRQITSTKLDKSDAEIDSEARRLEMIKRTKDRSRGNK